MTPRQAHNLKRLWPVYGLDCADGPFRWPVVFGRDAPRTLEIGFGAGEVLAALAVAHPEQDFIGVEVYRSGVGRLLGRAEQAGLDNLRLFAEDAVTVLERAVPPSSIDSLLLYFPDPWPKKRHHKRRLVVPEFAASVARVLRPGGVWRLATDWEPYAQWMRAVLDVQPTFANVGDADGFVGAPPRPATRFEQRGRRKGHAVRDLAYRRK